MSQKAVDAINASHVPFVESELDDFVARTIKADAQTTSTDTPAADAYVVAMPTRYINS